MGRHPALAAVVVAGIFAFGTAGTAHPARDNVSKPPPRAVRGNVTRPAAISPRDNTAKPSAVPPRDNTVKSAVSPSKDNTAKPAKFDHKSLGKEGKNCIKCHKKEPPKKK